MADPAQVTFYDSCVPPLGAGSYTITVSQALTVDVAQTQADGGVTDIPSAPQPPVSQTVIVRGPRFAVDPADVHRRFPPDAGIGQYDQYLPLIVLNKRALPWEPALPPPHARPSPWLALMVFTDDQLLTPSSSADPNSQQNLTRVTRFPLDQVVTATFNGKPTTGPPAGTLGPSITLSADEDPTSITCDTIELSMDTFTALVPSAQDLPYLAHVRQVSTANKAPLSLAHDGWFSVILANRFAVPPVTTAANIADTATTASQRNIVHLVSLEGFDLTDAGARARTASGYQRVRLISLHGWSFTCVADPRHNFRELMLGLIAPQHDLPPDLRLRMPLPEGLWMMEPDPGPDAAAFTRLRDGHVPLGHTTASGEQTFAWYRGPLSPVPTQEFLQAPDPTTDATPRTAQSAADLMIYDAQHGLFDQSYAVAFETGRSLALASLPFATNLLQWRRLAHTSVDRALATRLRLARTRVASGAAPPAPLMRDDATALRRLMQEPEVASTLRRTPHLSAPANADEGDQADQTGILAQIVAWLAQIALLQGVPFDALVPHPRLLPAESIRFFYLDANWIDSLLDGALSIGVHSSRDIQLDRLTRPSLKRQVHRALGYGPEIRRGLRGAAPPPATPRPAGFLLRSAVVADWPGLEVQAWSAADASTPMVPLRLDRVASGVLIAIYPDVPVTLQFNEPSEGLVCGVEDEGIRLRYVPGLSGATASNIGQVITPDTPILLTPAEIAGTRRATPPGSGALTIAGAGGLAQAIQKKLAGIALTPASLAVQLVRVPEQMLFQSQSGPGAMA